MGGKFSPHLTSEVTHLISKNTDSEKYKVNFYSYSFLKECYLISIIMLIVIYHTIYYNYK